MKIPKAIFTSITACLLLLAQQGNAQRKGLPNDPLAPFLFSKPAAVTPIDSKEDSIIFKRFTFPSRKGANTIYGTLASPKTAGSHPAMLMLHGGASCADEVVRLQKVFAAKGYVVMAVDLPGICNPEKAKYSTGAWRNRPKGIDSRLDIEKGLDSSTLVDAIAAGLEGYNLLLAESNVDKTHVGITGYSWGGYMTTMLSSLLGNRVHAAYSVFGCGFYDRGSLWTEQLAKMPVERRQQWLTYFDAGRRAPNMRSAYFIEATVNDKYFWPEAVTATLDTIKTEKNLLWSPNMDHTRPKVGERLQTHFFNYYLKGMGQPLGQVTVAKGKNNQLHIGIKMPAGITVEKVELYFAAPNADRHNRQWTAVPVTKAANGQYQVNQPETGTDYFIYVTDSRQLSVSSYVYNN